MALLAMAIPVPAAQKDRFQKFIKELQGPRHGAFVESRKRLGVHERTFLQTTPMGDFVVVTLEGADPQGAFSRFGQGTDDFTKWFKAEVQAIHGMDLAAPPPAFPQLLVDSAK
jgi:hypothetical protein